MSRIIVIAFLAQACIDDTSQEKEAESVTPIISYRLFVRFGNLRVRKEDQPRIFTPVIVKDLVVATSKLTKNNENNVVWTTEPLKFEKIHFRFWKDEKLYDCNLPKDSSVVGLTFNLSSCQQVELDTDADITFLNDFFKDCQATLVKNKINEIGTLTDDNENTTSLKYIRGYVYQGGNICKKTNYPKNIEFVITPSALTLFKTYGYRCEKKSGEEDSWRLQPNRPSYGLLNDTDCHDELAIFYGKTEGTDVFIQGSQWKQFKMGAGITKVQGKLTYGNIQILSRDYPTL